VAKVSHIVSGLTHSHSTALPAAHSTAENSSVCVGELALGGGPPRGALHARVDVLLDQAVEGGGGRGHQPDADAAGTALARSGRPGSASSMPMTAQKTISCTTRGLVSA
jgi:hypothetical protein